MSDAKSESLKLKSLNLDDLQGYEGKGMVDFLLERLKKNGNNPIEILRSDSGSQKGTKVVGRVEMFNSGGLGMPLEMKNKLQNSFKKDNEKNGFTPVENKIKIFWGNSQKSKAGETEFNTNASFTENGVCVAGYSFDYTRKLSESGKYESGMGKILSFDFLKKELLAGCQINASSSKKTEKLILRKLDFGSRSDAELWEMATYFLKLLEKNSNESILIYSQKDNESEAERVGCVLAVDKMNFKIFWVGVDGNQCGSAEDRFNFKNSVKFSFLGSVGSVGRASGEGKNLSLDTTLTKGFLETHLGKNLYIDKHLLDAESPEKYFNKEQLYDLRDPSVQSNKKNSFSEGENGEFSIKDRGKIKGSSPVS